ncbi:MAG: hypothetical protein NT133_19065 [Alphaproteobacteria bacterium]|nr:hypothetical protein [Alphaproteobacteria bacterium]
MAGTTISTYQGIGLALVNTSQSPVVVTSTGMLVGATSGITGGAAHNWKIRNDGFIGGNTAGIFLYGAGIIQNGLGGQISGFDYGIMVGDGARIVNNGLITARVNGIGAGNGLTLINSGNISNVLGTNPPSIEAGADIIAISGTITNTGMIYAYRTGISLSAGGTVTNSGQILADRADYAGAGVASGGTLTLKNLASGLIEAKASSVPAAYAEKASGVFATYAKIVNSGTIRADTGKGIVATLGLTLTNSGTISGYSNAVDVVSGSATITNLANGIISSGATGFTGFSGLSSVRIAGTAVVTNFGTINQADLHTSGVVLAGGTVSNLGTSALITGYFGVYASEYVTTVINQGSIVNGAFGVRLGAGGSVANQGTSAAISSGSVGVEIAGGGTITNEGIIGADGNAIALPQGGTVINAGTITAGQYGIYTYYGNATTVTNSGLIRGSARAIYLEGNGTITNGASGATLATILSSSTGGGTTAIDIAGNADITNWGTIAVSTPDGLAVRVFGGGKVRNLGTAAQISGIEGGVGGAPFTVVNQGTVSGQIAVSIDNGGMLSNQGALSLLTGATGAELFGSPTVFNAGTIEGTAGPALALPNGGQVANSGTIMSSRFGILTVDDADVTLNNAGLITAADDGVSLAGAGEIFNTGVVRGTSGSGITLVRGFVSNTGVVQGAYAGIGFWAGGATVFNNGAITATDSSAHGRSGYGIFGLGDLNVNNGLANPIANPAATVTGGTSNYAYAVGALGVLNLSNAGTINGGISINAGIITNFAGGVIENTLAALYDGYDAVFTGTALNTLIEDPGASLGNGNLSGQGTGGTNLILAAGAPGSLDLAILQGFNLLSVEPGANWSVANPLLVQPTSGPTNIVITAGASLDVTSILTTSGGVVNVTGPGSFAVDGSVIIGSGGTLTAGNIGGAGTISLGSFSLFTVTGSVAPAVAFTGGDGTVELTVPGHDALGTIAGFSTGDFFDLDNYAIATWDIAGQTLSLTGTSGAGALSLTFDSGTDLTHLFYTTNPSGTQLGIT